MPTPPSDRPDRLLLLDTASLYFRAFFGVPDSMRAPDGAPVNAVRGLLDMIARFLLDVRPTRLVACWDDDWRPAFRVEAVPTYKAHRVASAAAGPETTTETDGETAGLTSGETGAEEVPAALTAQIPIIIEALAALGLCRVGAPGFEADDVIATLAEQASGSVDVVTGDRDLFQVIDDARGVRVLYTARGVARHEVITDAVVRARYGVSAAEYADFATLRGDPSDGLPGVPGVGEKTAARLMRDFGSLAAIQAAAATPGSGPALRPTLRAALLGAADYLSAATGVVRVVRDVPLPRVDDRLPAAPPDPDAVVALAETWGIGGSLARVVRALDAVAAGQP